MNKNLGRGNSISTSRSNCICYCFSMTHVHISISSGLLDVLSYVEDNNNRYILRKLVHHIISCWTACFFVDMNNIGIYKESSAIVCLFILPLPWCQHAIDYYPCSMLLKVKWFIIILLVAWLVFTFLLGSRRARSRKISLCWECWSLVMEK